MIPNLPLDQSLNETFFKFCNNYPDSLVDTLRALAYYNPNYNTSTRVELDIMASKDQGRQMAPNSPSFVTGAVEKGVFNANKTIFSNCFIPTFEY